MLIGGFIDNERGRPSIDAIVSFPELHRSGRVSFIIDTGADISLLGPSACDNLDLSPILQSGHAHVVRSPDSVVGIGGAIHPFLAKACVTFTVFPVGELSLAMIDIEQLDLVPPALAPGYEFSSVIGWDILQRFEGVYLNRGKGQVFLLGEGEHPPQ